VSDPFVQGTAMPAMLYPSERAPIPPRNGEGGPREARWVGMRLRDGRPET
jgi:hypothetical protein